MALKLCGAFLLSLLLMLIFMPMYISFLKKISFNQSVSEYSLKEYKEKAKTPTMGGVMFVVVSILVTIAIANKKIMNIETAVVMLAFLGYSFIGFIDDYIIVIKNDNEGLKPNHKFMLQLLLAIVFYVLYYKNVSLDVIVPIANISLGLGGFYIILVFFMFTGSSNAVNLTDGMDGLAAGCSVFSYIPFLVFSIMANQEGLAIFICALLGALIGYLKYNITPAKVFMGDTGSLALGGGLAALAMVLKKEILLIVIGGVFVWETVCVILQISSVKLRGKKIFKYTPIHYSFVLDGMSEKRVVRSFWIIAAICAGVGLVIGLI